MNQQEKQWHGKLGNEYVENNSAFFTNEELFENKHKDETVYSVYQQMFGDLDRNYTILEVGCNVGHKLERLRWMGFKNLYGLDVNEEAIKVGRELYPEINFFQTSFDDYNTAEQFDIVMTNYAAIHVSPKNFEEFTDALCTLSRKYVFMMEFDKERAPNSLFHEMIKWLGKNNICWKRPMDKIFDKERLDLSMYEIRHLKLPRVEDENFDGAYLWEKYTS